MDRDPRGPQLRMSIWRARERCVEAFESAEIAEAYDDKPFASARLFCLSVKCFATAMDWVDAEFLYLDWLTSRNVARSHLSGITNKLLALRDFEPFIDTLRQKATEEITNAKLQQSTRLVA